MHIILKKNFYEFTEFNNGNNKYTYIHANMHACVYVNQIDKCMEKSNQSVLSRHKYNQAKLPEFSEHNEPITDQLDSAVGSIRFYELYFILDRTV